MVCRYKGFTLVELLITVAILGVLAATAVPAYRAWQQRAYGREADVMLRQLINAEIAYYLENDKFFDTDKVLSVMDVGPDDAAQVIFDNLHLRIPQGHYIDYGLYAEEDIFTLVMTVSDRAGFNLFKDAPQVVAILNKDGNVTINYSVPPE